MTDKTAILKNAVAAKEYIESVCSLKPETAVILGSGLGSFASGFKILADIPFSRIPHFPVATAPDHAGKLLFVQIGSKTVLIMQGRLHYYEGYSMDEVVFPIRVMKLMGIKNIIVTNAAGAINESFHTGGLMLISDHIKFFNDTPLRGANIDDFGPRFNDMSDAYTKALRAVALDVAAKANIPLFCGVYAYMPGPCFETPAEIRMLKTLGADAVGMSTVPEVICASHSGINVIGISFLTNMAAGIYEKIEELKYTGESINNFKALISGIIDRI